MLQSKPFQVVSGVILSEKQGIIEAYEERRDPHGHWAFAINVSAEKIATVFKRLVQVNLRPGFWLLEMGNAQCQHTCDISPLRSCLKSLYYLHGINAGQAIEIFDRYQEVLIHDGSISFGFCAAEGCNDVYVGGYKLFEVYSHQPESYRAALRELRFDEVPELKTLWHSEHRPRACQFNVSSQYMEQARTMVRELEAMGMQPAEVPN